MEYPKIYNTVGNCGSTYQVRILSPTEVHVHKRNDKDIPTHKFEYIFSEELNAYVYRIINADEESDDDEESPEAYTYAPIHTFANVVEIFIGKSPMTEYSVGQGDQYDGNTILLHLGGCEYIYIGDGQIRKFIAKNKIIAYSSPVGNSSVPYPFATDDHNLVYLMVEDVIIKKNVNYDDPYSDFYNNRCISNNFAGITEYFSKDDNDAEWRKYNLSYDPNIVHRYYRITQNGTTRDINADELRQIMTMFANSVGIEPLIMTNIHTFI